MSGLTITRWVSSTPTERWHEESPAAGPGPEAGDLRPRISDVRQQTWRGFFAGCHGLAEGQAMMVVGR